MGKRANGSTRRRPVSRRDFLAVGSLSVVSFPAAERAARLRAKLGRGPKTVVLVMMNGGASSFETFDPKPTAPKEIRGPYRAIESSIPGIHLSELLPKLAERAHQFALVRSVHHSAAPIHETGLQYLQSGGLAARDSRPGALGSMLQHRSGYPNESQVPAYVVTPRRLFLGERSPVFDGSGTASDAVDPSVIDDSLPADENCATRIPGRFTDQPQEVCNAYGRTPFGRSLWNARQLVEQGVSWVTVNLFDNLHGLATWDAHGAPAAPATVADYGHTLCPQFDRAMSGFLDDLAATGLWNDVLVVCTGEMGRAARINTRGGRDHWTRCWSALVAGGGIPGGTVIGASDARAAEPADRPVHARDLAATAFAAATGGSWTEELPQLAQAKTLPDFGVPPLCSTTA
jgi:hypothetical protein